MLTLTVTKEELRSMVRIKTDALDDELNSLKDAFLTDLCRVGVQQIPEGDALAKACLRLYLRWQENYNGEADRYATAYRGTRNGMALAEEYRKDGGL